MKPLIICITGESGAGKTLLAAAAEDLLGVKLLQSYTDRPPREPGENGHTFISKEEFDNLPQEDMIAFTEWNGVRYCCLHEDVHVLNTYVIDEAGLLMLQQRWSHLYDIVSIRIVRPVEERAAAVGMARVSRDEDKFWLDNTYYDYVIYNRNVPKEVFRDRGVRLLKDIVSLHVNILRDHEDSIGEYL